MRAGVGPVLVRRVTLFGLPPTLTPMPWNPTGVIFYGCRAGGRPCLTTKAVLQRNGLNPGELNMSLGGPPCQGFNSAGGQARDDPRKSFLSHHVRLLKGVRPKAFFAKEKSPSRPLWGTVRLLQRSL